MKVITAVVNNPIFIYIQYHTLKKYMKNDYEFIVFNDAKDFPDNTNYGNSNMKNNIEKICSQLKIKCINIPNEHHKVNNSPVSRCAESMNFILKYQINNPDKYLVIDSDMFLIDFFDINQFSNSSCAIVLQSRNNNEIKYIWNGLYYFDFYKINNINLLNWNDCEYCDVGGSMQEWFKKQSNNNFTPTVEELRYSDENFNNENIYYIRHLWSTTWNENELPIKFKNKNKLIEFLKNDKRNINNNFFCEIYDNKFFHYRAGGNWLGEGLNFHIENTKNLHDILLNLD